MGAVEAEGEWESGRVGEWESGRVGARGSGRVGEWEQGGVGAILPSYSPHHPIALSPPHPLIPYQLLMSAPG